jgi:hypothetical protein
MTLVLMLNTVNQNCVEMMNSKLYKSYIFWDTTSHSPLRVNQHFGGTSRLHFQCQRISQARYEHQAGSKHSALLATGVHPHTDLCEHSIVHSHTLAWSNGYLRTLTTKCICVNYAYHPSVTYELCVVLSTVEFTFFVK